MPDQHLPRLKPRHGLEGSIPASERDFEPSSPGLLPRRYTSLFTKNGFQRGKFLERCIMARLLIERNQNHFTFLLRNGHRNYFFCKPTILLRRHCSLMTSKCICIL